MSAHQKRPTARALSAAYLELERARDLGRDLRLDSGLSVQDYWTRHVADLESVMRWVLEHEVRERVVESLRCTVGRNHRVRVTEPQGDGIIVERCRCGAERVRDTARRDFSDWHRPARAPSAP